MVRQTSSTGETILHYIDEVDHLDEVRPSSVVKNTLADLKNFVRFLQLGDLFLQPFDFRLRFSKSSRAQHRC